jgi:hypothetical protein
MIKEHDCVVLTSELSMTNFPDGGSALGGQVS